MITAIVVDDEWAAGQWLSLKLKETGRIKVLQVLQNPLELMAHIYKAKADVVFLDIAMPEMTGLELAEELSTLEQPPEVIFVTAYGDYALDAFRVNALDYIVKPIHEKELQRMLTKLSKRLSRDRYQDNTGNKGKYHFSVSDTKLDFATAKCEELFFYILLRGKQPFSKWEIIEDLWPGKEPDKGESSLRTTVFRLNQTLEKSGLDLRVKASKGYYHFIDASLREEQVEVQPFPADETTGNIRGSLAVLLQQYNFLQLTEEKDYIWGVMLKQYETDYYQWAVSMIKNHGEEAQTSLQALNYLLEQFPWKEPLVLQIMPLIIKIEGRGALMRFYQQQEARWKLLYNITLSKTIQHSYESLLE